MTSHSATAPEKTRMSVNVAGSIAVVFSASRQSSELLAKAIIAASVSRKSRADFNSGVVYRNGGIVARLKLPTITKRRQLTSPAITPQALAWDGKQLWM